MVVVATVAIGAPVPGGETLAKTEQQHGCPKQITAPARGSSRWVRGLLMCGLAAGIGAGTVLVAAESGMNILVAMIGGVLCGGGLGLIAGMVLFAIEEKKLEADRAAIIRRIKRLASVDRRAQFEALMAIDAEHPYAELCAVVHEVMIDAHKSRLEVSMLRRDLEDRVVKTASKQTAHLTRMSCTDELTGLANRRGFESGLESMIERALREHFEVCLMAIDLDHFKQLNDTLGHEKGDAALIAVGEIIRGHLRERDLGARVGGDELFFAVAGSSVEDAKQVAARITELFRVHPEGLGLRCPWPGLSIGIAAVQAHGARDAATLRRMADMALYASKRGGRSRITVFGDHEGSEEQRDAA